MLSHSTIGAFWRIDRNRNRQVTCIQHSLHDVNENMSGLTARLLRGGRTRVGPILGIGDKPIELPDILQGLNVAIHKLIEEFWLLPKKLKMSKMK